MPAIAFFDVDKTIIQGYSGYYATMHLMKHGAIRKRRIAKAIFYKVISKIYRADVRKIYETVLGDMAGSPIESAMAIGAECFQSDIYPRIFTDALQLLQYHQQQGHLIYLVSSGPYMVLKSLGDHIGANADWTPCPVIKDGIMQKKIKEPLAYKDGKLEVAKAVAVEHGASLQECFFYTDSMDDIALLESVGHPCAVNPDSQLLKHAERYGWPVKHYDQCIGEAYATT